MRDEIEAAANFIIKAMKMAHGDITQQIGDAKLNEFVQAIIEELTIRYTGHWFPSHPIRGNGYRNIKLTNKPYLFDKTIEKAVLKVGLPIELVRSTFTSDLTMWVDPNDVSYRFGDKGSVSVLYLKRDGNAGANFQSTNGQHMRTETDKASSSKPGGASVSYKKNKAHTEENLANTSRQTWTIETKNASVNKSSNNNSYTYPSPSTSNASLDSSASNSAVVEEKSVGKQADLNVPTGTSMHVKRTQKNNKMESSETNIGPKR